jgi:hypothetical protein
MTNYRPITDIWILARPKLNGGRKYYGAYPAGFLQRARDLLGCGLHDPVLHVCGGMARHYPYTGFGPNDQTLDLDPGTQPDFCRDVLDAWPYFSLKNAPPYLMWRGIIADPPYSEDEATNYAPGKVKYPRPAHILTRATECLQPGRRIGILHYLWVKPVPGLRPVAVICVLVGCNNRARLFSVFEREAKP